MDELHFKELRLILDWQRQGDWSLGMRFFSELGPGVCLAGLPVVIYLAANRTLGARMAMLYFLGMWLNEVLKLAFHSPRPFWLDTRVKVFHGAPGQFSYSLPSGHAQVAASCWLYLAWVARRPWAWGAAFLIVSLISLSRVFLGVHFPSDVLSGIVMGILWLAIFIKWSPKVEARLGSASLEQQVILATLTASIMAFTGVMIRAAIAGSPDPAAWSAFNKNARAMLGFAQNAGAILGIAMGLVMAQRWARFDPGGPPRMRLMRILLAAVGAGVIYLAFNELRVGASGAGAWSLRFMVGTAMGWWLFFAAPWLALRTGLAVAVGETSSGEPGAQRRQ